jgi:hypothetical protein
VRGGVTVAGLCATGGVLVWVVPLAIDGDPEGDVVALEFAVLDLRGSAGHSVDGSRNLRIALQRQPDRHVPFVVFERPGPPRQRRRAVMIVVSTT